MSSAGAEPGNVAAAPQVCPHCQKSFPRLCDLNKHAKSHSRPFKCTIPTCKYHDHGWPTAKELERHVNDKHSAAPRTFPCLFPSCTYESKRESNCKQHMEKKHNWKYVRSKSNGKRLASEHPVTHSRVGTMSRLQMDPSGLGQSSSAHAMPASTGSHAGLASNGLTSVPPSSHDFVLFPDDAEAFMVIGEDDEDLGPDHEDPQNEDSRVYIPWTSPATRLVKNQSMLDLFAQTYNTPGRTMNHPDAMIDPSLQQYNHMSIPDFQGLNNHRLSAVDGPIKTEAPNMAMDQISWNRGSDTGSAPADSPSDRRNPSTAYSSQFHTPHNGSLDFTGPPVQADQMGWSQFKPRRRGSDDDGHRPEKKLKSTTVDEFTDTNMPDIFRFAHPQIYDRDQKEKYSPCHSSHRDISTLVRHLGRPAHRLTVTREAISSFDIEDDDYPHPRIGICRRCWVRFPERSAFDEHTSSACEKVSKGKREKWHILYESLTPLVHHSTNPAQVDEPPLSFERVGEQEEPRRSPSRQSGFFTAAVEGVTWDDPASPPTSVPSPTTFIPQPSALPTSAFENVLVSKREYERLQKEHNDLREKHQKLAIASSALILAMGSRNSSGTLPASSTASAGATVSPTSNSKDTPSDRDSLVLHTQGSPLGAVDVQGLMNEPKETLSRQNSDLSSTSTSRSTILHVTTSPPPLPPLPFELEGDGDDDDDNEGGGFHPPGEDANPNRKPPTSIPDSGYASAGNYHRNGSFGEIGCMPGAPDFHHQHPPRGHHRNSSSLSTLTAAYPQHDPNHHHIGSYPDKSGPADHHAGIPWRPNIFGSSEAPGATSAQPALTGSVAGAGAGAGAVTPQDQQHHHTFMPDQQMPDQQAVSAAEPPFEGLNFLNLDYFNMYEGR